MFRGRIFVAAVFAVVITAGLAVCGPAQAHASAPRASSLHAATASHRTSALTPCSSIRTIPGWFGIYSACSSVNGEFLQLTNTSVWDVLYLQVRYPSSVYMTISTPRTDSALMDLAEELEFPARTGSTYALVPPGATLSTWSVNRTPVRLFISVENYYTTWNVAASGLVSAIQDHVLPLWSEAESIIACADYVHSLPRPINQWKPNSPEFWNSFANVASCYDAFHGWSEALGGVGEKAIIDDAEHDTAPFFDNLLKFIDLVGEDIFH